MHSSSLHRALAARARTALERAFLAGCLAAGVAAPAAAQSYGFESSPVTTGTPLSITSAGVTATFTSPGDPGAFVVETSFLGPASALAGRVLYRPSGVASLNIGFSTMLSDITLAFATISVAPLTLQAFQGATLVGSISATGGTSPALTFPEGLLAFSGVAFSSVRLSAPVEFAIDDVRVRTASVIPEPSSVALLATGLGLAGLVGARRRRNARAH